MKRIKSWKLFESHLDDIEEEIGDILIDLCDEGFVVDVVREFGTSGNLVSAKKQTYIHINLKRAPGSKDRVIPGAPTPPSGVWPGPIFMWFEVRDAVVRLNHWYYDFSNAVIGTPGLSLKNLSQLRNMGIDYKSSSAFRLFNGVREFGFGYHNSEDFENLDDFLTFVNLKIIIKI